MNWHVLIGLAAVTFALKAVGPVLARGRTLPTWVDDIAAVIPLAVFPALVASSTFRGDGGIVVDARVVAAAVVLVVCIVLRKALFGAATAIGAAITALIRSISS